MKKTYEQELKEMTDAELKRMISAALKGNPYVSKQLESIWIELLSRLQPKKPKVLKGNDMIEGIKHIGNHLNSMLPKEKQPLTDGEIEKEAKKYLKSVGSVRYVKECKHDFIQGMKQARDFQTKERV